MEEGGGIGVEADLGVGRAGFGAGKAFVVDEDVHGLDGADLGIEDVGDGHGIEEGGRLLAPFVIEESEGVGEGSSLLEEKGALSFVKFELGRVEGHDVERDTGEEEFFGGGDVVDDVPLGAAELGQGRRRFRCSRSRWSRPS